MLEGKIEGLGAVDKVMIVVNVGMVLFVVEGRVVIRAAI